MRVPPLLAAGLVVATAACKTAPAPLSGYLTGYEGLATKPGTLRVSVRERRDDARAATVETLYIQPAALHPGAAEGLSPADVALVLGEVDRQACYELSERFTLTEALGPDVGVVRFAITRLRGSEPAAAGVAAVANTFIPGPIGVRAPGATGALAAEAELVGADGVQISALAFARQANVVGTDTPSLSRVGDALQFADVLGDQVGDSFAAPGRKVRAIPTPDPCERFGPRAQPAGFLARLVTGLYVPQAQGVRPQRPMEQDPTVARQDLGTSAEPRKRAPD